MSKAKPARPGQRVPVPGAHNVTAEVISGPVHPPGGVRVEEVTEPTEPAPGAEKEGHAAPAAPPESSPVGPAREAAGGESQATEREKRAFQSPPTAGPRVQHLGGRIADTGGPRVTVIRGGTPPDHA